MDLPGQDGHVLHQCLAQPAATRTEGRRCGDHPGPCAGEGSEQEPGRAGCPRSPGSRGAESLPGNSHCVRPGPGFAASGLAQIRPSWLLAVPPQEAWVPGAPQSGGGGAEAGPGQRGGSGTPTGPQAGCHKTWGHASRALQAGKPRQGSQTGIRIGQDNPGRRGTSSQCREAPRPPRKGQRPVRTRSNSLCRASCEAESPALVPKAPQAQDQHAPHPWSPRLTCGGNRLHPHTSWPCNAYVTEGLAPRPTEDQVSALGRPSSAQPQGPANPEGTSSPCPARPPRLCPHQGCPRPPQDRGHSPGPNPSYVERTQDVPPNPGDGQ